MKILVIEDKEIHRTSAVETLVGHELTIVSSFDEGIRALSTGVDEGELKALKKEVNFPEYPRGESVTEAEKSAWYARFDELKEQARSRPDFEVVLTDMNMPMSRETLAPGVHERGVEVPYGFVLTLPAAQVGAKFVALVTDTNHHKGAMSAALDHLGDAYYSGREKPLQVNGAKVLFLHAPFVEDVIKDAPCESCGNGRPGVCVCCKGTLKYGLYDDPCTICEENPGKCHGCRGTAKADKKVYVRKNWGQVLTHLLKN